MMPTPQITTVFVIFKSDRAKALMYLVIDKPLMLNDPTAIMPSGTINARTILLPTSLKNISGLSRNLSPTELNTHDLFWKGHGMNVKIGMKMRQ
jgi:hypothetical protein